ncbi:ArsR/SmtB family transcription factor [Dactylosporangium sp. NPDC048998]|uniref:ArsR/SmtB family transcription factor n=1 Tax=Dactylosporangium sp. NPDC048998 TaxID=3363976 RepID=UPI003720B6FE
MPEPEVMGLEALRLMAHPLRQKIEREMRKGPVSATSLARALGESTGLTSYHLRQLAKHGFVEEVPELARGRERWWRVVPKDRRFPLRREQGEELRAVLDEMVRRDLAADLAEFSEAQGRQADAEDPWTDAFPFSRGSVTLTIEELRDFFEAYIALLYKYRRPPEETPPGARTLQVRMYAFPDEQT